VRISALGVEGCASSVAAKGESEQITPVGVDWVARDINI